MNSTIHTWVGLVVEDRTFDVTVFIEYSWDDDGQNEPYAVSEDFHIQEVVETLPDKTKKVIDFGDPIRWEILGEIDYLIEEALIGLTKNNE